MATSIAEKDIVQAKKEIEGFLSGMPMTVTSKEASLQAQAAVVQVRAEQKKREAWFQDNILSHAKKSFDQAKASYDAQRAVLADLLAPLTKWDRATSSNILLFETRERERIRKEQEKENAKFARRIEAAQAKGKEVETVRPPRLVAPAVKTTKSIGGAFTIKTEKVLLVFDDALVPEKYWIRTRNDALIKSDLRAGIDVPGAMLKEELRDSVRPVR